MPFIVDPPRSTFTDGIQASLLPWGDYTTDWQKYNAALASMFEEVWGIVSDQGSPDEPGFTAGWSTLLDPDACPNWALPFCGMFVGVFVPPGTDEQTARAQIKDEQGFSRGTPGAIIAAAQRFLSGSQSAVLQERTAANGSADPYHFVLLVAPSQVTDAVALAAAVDAVRPAGVQWTLIEAEGFTWNEAINAWSVDTQTWDQTSSIQP